VLGPYTFNFLGGFQLGTQHMVDTRPTLADYFDNLTNIILGCGIAFELPVLSFVLTKIGLITPMLMKSTRRYAIVIILFIAAFITPSPDWYSQTIVFTPLMLLYELSILVSKRVYKQEQEREKEEPEEWS
jgi:sec-independent protein translocase protein TatC